MKEILLVEDSDQDAELVERALKRFGVTNPLRRLSDGTEAMAYLARAETLAAVGPPVPSVLLLDVKLPGMSGFEILEYLQNRSAFASTLKIVLSQIEDLHSIKHAYSLGAQSFLSKPVNLYELHNLVATFPSHWILKAGTGETRNREKG